MNTKQIKDTPLGNLTVGEFQKLMRAEMQQAVFDFLWELQQYMPDPDEGLELKPEVAQKLRSFIEEKSDEYTKSLEDVSRELGLDE